MDEFFKVKSEFARYYTETFSGNAYTYTCVLNSGQYEPDGLTKMIIYRN